MTWTLNHTPRGFRHPTQYSKREANAILRANKMPEYRSQHEAVAALARFWGFGEDEIADFSILHCEGVQEGPSTVLFI